MHTLKHLIWLIVVLPLWPVLSHALDKDIIISAYQGPVSEGDFSKNLSTVRKVIEAAKARGSHFVAFPETFLSGYENRERVEQGARSLEDPELRKFIAESSAHDMVIMVGIARKVGQRIFNTVLVIHHGQLLGYYDKVMLTEGDSDESGFQPGKTVPVFFAHGVRFAVIICHDTSFPHVALAAKLQGAELLFAPHYNEIGESAADDHRRWVRNCHIGLACQLKMVVARANVVKSSRPGRIGYGDSIILSPQGEPLAEAKLFKTELITASITPAMFKWPYVGADLHEVPAWLRTQLARQLTDFRSPANEDDLRYWLENMAVYHHYTPNEISDATGLSQREISVLLRKFNFLNRPVSDRMPGAPLRVLPYPGGRHPRTGFLEGAVMPQRETKISIFTPWDVNSYVVADVPEAVWSNLGLTYLAHTHIPSLWDQQGIVLPRLEWNRQVDGTLTSERLLPNGIAFGTKITPTPTEVRMALWLRNGTEKTLTGLRIQNCVMLKAAAGFSEQTITNKFYQPPFATVRDDSGNRWLITAWDSCDRCWGNEQVPCLHSDPKFPDCPPGETVRLHGWLSFYEGVDLTSELQRIKTAGWLKP